MRNAVTYVSALAIAAGMAATPVMAQSQSGETTQPETGQAQGATTQQAPASEPAVPGSEGEQAEGQQADQLIATVGGDEIRQSDVTATIQTLPPRVQQTPPQMLLPAVVDQLIMRRLIADEARAEGLESDAEVQELVGASDDAAMEQALVEVWLKREIGERVTDENVQAALDEMKAQNPDMGDDTPGLTQQVRQALQVQAMTDISEELRSDAEITFYGPDGQPVEPTQQVGSGAEGESQTDTETETQTQN